MPHKDEMSNEEIEIFNKEFYHFVKSNYPESTHEILKEFRDAIITSIMRTKFNYQANFGGIFPHTGEFGWSFPHPMLFFDNKNTWINQFKKGAWNIWINKDLYSSNSTFLLFGFYSLSSRQVCNISAIYIKSDGRTYPPFWLKNTINESRVYILPKPILIENSFISKTLSEDNCACELIPLGIYFGSKLYEICYRQSQPQPQVNSGKRI